jgi:hypothetical protein
LAPQIEKLKQRFHLDHVLLAGDHGIITDPSLACPVVRITEDIKSARLD